MPPTECHSAARLDAAHATAWQASAMAAVVDLVQRTAQAESLSAACRTQVNALKLFLACEQVALGLRRRGRGRCRLMAVSGMADFDPQGAAPRTLEAEMDATILSAEMQLGSGEGVTGGAGVSPATCSRDHRDTTRSLCVPLRTEGGAIIGAWICKGGGDGAALETNRRFLETAAPPAAETLRLLERAEGALPGRVLRRIASTANQSRRRAAALAAAAVACLMLLPVPYDVGVECELQPNVKRFVAAPQAGEFQKSLVKPGDLVAAGQLLARMDGRDVRWELASAVAEEQRVRKFRDVNAAEGKTAAAQIDALEVRRQQVKEQMLERRLAELDIKSPIDGIVVAGDLERSEGATVSVGQVLYEVAPLACMTAELAVTDAEIAGVAPEMPVTLRLDSQPRRQWSGSIARIHPRAVTREKDNVFIAEVALDNGDGALRPGMKGRAEIRTSRRSLGWVLFHRPWNYLTSCLDW